MKPGHHRSIAVVFMVIVATCVHAFGAERSPADECRARIGKIVTPELRWVFERKLKALVEAKVEPKDASWARLRSCADLAVGDGTRITAATARASLDSLASFRPGRFSPAPDLSRRIDEHEASWQNLLAAAEREDECELRAVTRVQEETREIRRSMLRASGDLSDFARQWQSLDLVKEWEDEYDLLRRDVAARARFEKVAAETQRRDALIDVADRDPVDVVLRRTAALLDHLRPSLPASDANAYAADVDALRSTSARVSTDCPDGRFVLFAEACRLRRTVALRNPLLDFKDLVFIKRHRAIYEHMCDQFYGMAQRPGGGLYVLRDAFSPTARVRDVLETSTVRNGRLQGRRLGGGPDRSWNISFDGEGNLSGDDTVGGSFLSPDLSFDGKRIAFAYVECAGDKKHRHHTDPSLGHWAEGRCYHLFSVNVDGSDLRMLTDGTWNDFDPCFLPNGRIAFISERRGGYLRCGRTCPTYTLYDVAAHGSDITMLSPHETNEWHPSVTHDGRIIYTRWDYVDRHGCTAHLPWITTLDGRDSRAVHGNFAPRRERPDMELDVRAIPRSQKYVATAAPHHGQAFGSLVLVDPNADDVEPMAPVRRLTPDVGFPESQGGPEAYGTPWPLSEDFHLCVFSSSRSAGKHTSDYGIYLVDSFGNRDLIYRDPVIACLSPIPLEPRPMPAPPPALATPSRNAPGTQQQTEAKDAPEGTVLVVNAYDGLRPWPAGTKITALRVLQVVPMSVPSGRPPHETGIRVAMAEDSVVPVRHVLGTVPVERDGSAHFTVPADRELFFQALDERGLAVQSMRSATYLHAGERLVCQGCHEPTNAAPSNAVDVTLLAMKRAPSKLTPDVDGARPFSYPRLVQPVLDEHCVGCHSQISDIGPNLSREPIQRKFYASYLNLTPQYGFTSYGNNYYSVPGQFGARASKLLALLDEGHYGVKLPAGDLHRLTLWLDCASLFYGVYEKERGEAQLRGELAWPTLE
jgi:hypothetical protein